MTTLEIVTTLAYAAGVALWGYWPDLRDLRERRRKARR